MSLYNFTHMFWDQTLLHVVCIHFGLLLTKQPSYINQHRTLHNTLCTGWKVDFFLHIAPNLLLYSRRHMPSICDGDWDIVSNLKFGIAFEHFPCFRGFRWKPIQIKFCHVDHVGRHLIGTSLPPFSHVIGAIFRFYRGWTRFSGWGVRSQLA
jgi:hypothetical protein